ncbi:MAG: hypothetical protein ACO3SP_10150 [Ilumatobacteraceae bacterium]
MNWKTVAGAAVVAVALSGCMTGPRPRLIDDTTNAPLANESAQGLVEVLSATPAQPFTVVYDVLTKFGGQTTTATVTGDVTHGTAVEIGTIRYIFLPDGRTFTCENDTCATGTDETKVSDRQLTSRFFKESAIGRIRQDSRVAMGEITSADSQVAGNTALCIDVPVIDGNGASRTKSYCALSDYGMLASMDTADLTITARSVTSTADLSYFRGLPA